MERAQRATEEGVPGGVRAEFGRQRINLHGGANAARDRALARRGKHIAGFTCRAAYGNAIKLSADGLHGERCEYAE